MILGRTKSTNTRLVKGCPCYKEFGEEKVCINDDDVLPIRAISVDPSFFTQIENLEDLLEFKSDKENMCYLLIYLEKSGNFVYCVSRGMKLHINNREVKASDIKDALSFVSTTEHSTNGVVCSTCLYKYLVTLGDVFDDLISESERSEIIESYVKEIYMKMAVDLGGGDSEAIGYVDESIYSDLIRKQIEQLSRQRTELTENIGELREIEGKSHYVYLLEKYSQLCRLESVFLLQVMSLKESTDQFVAIGLLKFMIELSEQVMQINNSIREVLQILEEEKAVPQPIKNIIAINENHRRIGEHRFANLLHLLSQVRG